MAPLVGLSVWFFLKLRIFLPGWILSCVIRGSSSLFICLFANWKKQVKSPQTFFQVNQGWHDSTIQPFGIGRKPGLIPFFPHRQSRMSENLMWNIHMMHNTFDRPTRHRDFHTVVLVLVYPEVYTNGMRCGCFFWCLMRLHGCWQRWVIFSNIAPLFKTIVPFSQRRVTQKKPTALYK